MKKSLNLAQKTIEEFLSVIGIKDPFELSESEEGFDVGKRNNYRATWR